MSLTAADMARQPAVLHAMPARAAAAVEAARRLLGASRTVRLLGIGSSRHAAGYGATALDVLAGVPASVLPAAGRAVALPAFEPGDAVVAVSQSGSTPALLAAVAGARDRGARIVGVVNDDASALAALCDVVLSCGAGRERTVPATVSVTAQMLLLRLVAGDLGRAALDRLVAAVANCLELDPALPVDPPAHVVVGGFAAEWVAGEVALKFAEMASTLPSARSVVDHLHGPVAVVTPTLALLSRDEPNAEVLVRAGHVFTAGPSPAYDLVLDRTGDDSLDAIVRVVTGQVLALRWAARSGVDPDRPRGLAKVTATL